MTEEIKETITAKNKAQMLLKRDKLNITLRNQFKDIKKLVKHIIYIKKDILP